MANRTFGWIQNPSDFNSLQRVVQIFDPESAHYAALRDYLIERYIPLDEIKKGLQEKLDRGKAVFTYFDLVGRSVDQFGNTAKRRALAVGSSLIQVSIPSQSAGTSGKYWTDNWTSDGYLRWAVSLNFVEYLRDEGAYQISQRGLEFSHAESGEDRDSILTDAFLAYPPATRILSVLSERSPQNKFEMGHKLGFSGEPGFTSYSSDIMTDYLRRAENSGEAKSIRTDIEGTSDKYARMIAGWLSKLGLVASKSTKLSNVYLGTISGFRDYSITGRGMHIIRQAQGFSSRARVPKFVMWEFFATTGSDRAYVRSRRAIILRLMMDTPTKSFNSLIVALNDRGFSDEPTIIKNDIQGLDGIGIRISTDGRTVHLLDAIKNFDIPKIRGQNRNLDNVERDNRKAEFLAKTSLPPRFIELLSIAYESKSNRDFEMITAELFKDVYGLGAVHLGNAKKPDALAFNDDFGIIIDTKAYSNGYSKNINQEDEMVRYIEDNQIRSPDRNNNEWWLSFPPSIPENDFHFLWVSSYFTGRFEEQLQETSARTGGTTGGALDVEQLLIGGSLIQEGSLAPHEVPAYMQNRVIHFGDLN
ncbi:restriction endonuclease (plasmid) [Lacticaseibacillus paracasei]|uniref:restriction endonuclease FokI C-terminal domain-containing protein n=1 Tax=Lacticaseibacillus paracasei TaxID=1597 RepID=UPI0009C20960|nr:restriction endonuclease FokI C-terminal domain-containing protein [Lacticaseibacillus paracasei]ARE45508.1 restriction endonuclease [Lacticaseibacillus paracasei]